MKTTDMYRGRGAVMCREFIFSSVLLLVQVCVVPLQSHSVSGEGLSVLVQAEVLVKLKHRHLTKVASWGWGGRHMTRHDIT